MSMYKYTDMRLTMCDTSSCQACRGKIAMRYTCHELMFEDRRHRDFRKGKRQTKHQKGVPPAAALSKRKSGPVQLEYIKEYGKRSRTRSTRVRGLWKKARELAILTGIALKLIIRDEYFDSVESGYAQEDHITPQPEETNEMCTCTCTEAVQSYVAPEPSVDLSDPTQLSPRAVRLEPREETPIVPTTDAAGVVQVDGASNAGKVNPTADDDNLAAEDRSPTIEHEGICWARMADTTSEKQCNLCGGQYDQESRARLRKWIVCNQQKCGISLHGECLLGKSTKLTHVFVRKIPFLCPAH